MIARRALCALLCASALNYAHGETDTTESDKSNARAYSAHLMVFQWPDAFHSEQINWKSLYSLEGIPQYPTPSPEDESGTQAASIGALNTVFADYQHQVERRAHLLVNESWTLIFDDRGSEVEKYFHSSPLKDGYAELDGSIHIKLGRYLESEIQYRHFLFDSFTVPQTASEEILENPEASPTTSIRHFEPALVLELNQSNKTASKQLNYLDHPILGTLLYFEPMDLEKAEEQLTLEALMEKGEIRDSEVDKTSHPSPESHSTPETTDAGAPSQ